MPKKVAFKDKRPNVILLQDRVSHTSKLSLRPALRARRITPFSRDIQPIPRGAVLVNFGATEIPAWVRPDMVFLNNPDAIRDSSNKYHTFVKLKEAEVPTVKWTCDKGEASKWLDKGHKVLARLVLNSSGGRGIHVANTPVELRDAPLFTRYFPKTHEFRVHVVGNKAVDLVEKKIRQDLKEDKDNRVIRNHRNGWVFAHDSISLTDRADLDKIRELGVQAIRAVGLDFGAVDILACLDGTGGAPDRRLTKSVVCEVNAAPGIENTVTQAAYVNGLNELIQIKLGA
jgi:glutathione synthase/RimK-type ligase-like ATP-grasp enzyme